MLGRIYTFQREQPQDADVAMESVSCGALDAITEAISAQPGVCFETLTEADNPRPMVAILFDRQASVSPFDRYLEALLAQHGITVSVMRTSIGRAAIDASGFNRDTGSRAA